MSTGLTLATWILARAGGGSAGFSRGFGGGGGGFRGGGRGGGGFGTGFLFGFLFSGPGLVFIAIVAVLLLVFRVIIPRSRKAAEDARRAQRTHRRESETAGALAVAADDDEAFDRDHVTSEATRLVRETQEAWDARDRYRLATLLGPDLLVEWQRRLDDFDRRHWHDRVVLHGEPKVNVVGLTNRESDEDDRVVVHVRQRMENWADTPRGRIVPDGQLTPLTTMSEYWTLGKRGEHWVLISIEQDAEGDHQLDDQLVLAPDQDPELAGSTRTELATADAADSPTDVAGLSSTSFTDDAHAAALDLALVDDRFSPDVLDVAVRRAVAAWAEAIDGSDDALGRLATGDAVQELLYGGDTRQGTRLVVRGPRITDAVIEHLDGESRPPAMGIAVHYRARWYREDRDTTAVVEGSREKQTARVDHWTFELTDDADVPWRLVRSGAVA